jgi:hypothetical protein
MFSLCPCVFLVFVLYGRSGCGLLSSQLVLTAFVFFVRSQAAESGGGGGELVTDAEGHMHVEKVVQASAAAAAAVEQALSMTRCIASAGRVVMKQLPAGVRADWLMRPSCTDCRWLLDRY